MVWPAYMYRQELIELFDFEGYDAEVWVTRRGANGDVYDLRVNNIVRDIPHCITDDEEAIGYIRSWLNDRESIVKAFNIG